MYGAIARKAEVAYLVMLVTVSRKRVHKHGIHSQASVVVGLLYLVVLKHKVEWGAFLVHKAVGRNMIGAKLQGCVQIVLPVVQCLVRETEHKVDADVVYAGTAYCLDGFGGLCSIVATAYKAQTFVAECLHAKTDAVHAEVAHSGNKFCGDIIGVHLYRYLTGFAREKRYYRVDDS